VATCGPADRVGDACERARATGWEACVVVNEARVMLGLLGKRALEVDPTTPVEQAMDPGPSTFRPNVSLEEMGDYLREHQLTRAWVTTSDGKLVGLLERDLLEQRLLSRQRRSG
jgi:Mg/Co/Ni transporter MgtE